MTYRIMGSYEGRTEEVDFADTPGGSSEALEGVQGGVRGWLGPLGGGGTVIGNQLCLDFDRLSLADLRAMLRGGLVVESGATPNGKVRSYRLTAAGRILLQNQLNRPEDNFPTARR